MIQIQEAMAGAVQALRNEGVESPRFDAELLLADVVGVNRATILAWPERVLTPKELTRYRNLVARRAAREPLAYILGRREFYDLDYMVDARVLIPRPETELLVEHALSIARQWTGPIEIADVGAGSGIIAVTLAVKSPKATIYALDESAHSLDVTRENARRHGVMRQVHCLQGDLLAPLSRPVDLITANLPYVATGEWQALPPEIRDYEPRAALDGGLDGLSAIRRLLATAGAHLRAVGAVLVEIGANQGPDVVKLAAHQFPKGQVRLIQDYAGLDRLVVMTQTS